MASPPGEASGSTRAARLGPALLVAVAVAFNLWTLRAQAQPVQNLNDAAIHASMVRWAEERIREGHVPLDGWYPTLSMGASRFHHYQTLPHVITGGLSVVFGDATFRWLTYLMLALWPVAVWTGARLFDLDPWTAGMAALVSPLVVSFPGLGFEAGSYTWQGYGAWTQLWGMWLLPIAWSLSWRAVARGRSVALAALVVALTIAANFMIGYLALLAIPVWVLITPSELRRRLLRGLAVGAGALLVAAWTLVPLIVDSTWATRDEFSQGTFYADSFGAGRILRWLATGRIFDEGRLPVITVLVALGVVAAVVRFRRHEPSRAILAVGLLSLVLFFGRPTLGPLLRVLPGGGDLFLRRFITGVHMAGILLGGMGGAWAGRWAAHLRGRIGRRLGEGATLPRWAGAAVAVVAAVAVLTPAWIERARYEDQGAEWIREQRAADATDGADAASLIDRANALGGGRVYAGLRGGWGEQYLIDQVPMYAALVNRDADSVGFTRQTWSLMSNVESRLDDSNPAQLDLFGIRYLVYPEGRAPAAGAREIARSGRHVLWELSQVGYVNVVDTQRTVSADRTNVGAATRSVLTSDDWSNGVVPTVSFAGGAAAPSTIGAGADPEGPPGVVLGVVDRSRDGLFVARVRLVRPGMVVLKSSFDPRWTVTVDGVELPPQMVAPAYVGRIVPPGEHVVRFEYRPFGWYWLLLGIGVLTLLALWLGPRVRRWVRRRYRRGPEREEPHPGLAAQTSAAGVGYEGS